MLLPLVRSQSEAPDNENPRQHQSLSLGISLLTAFPSERKKTKTEIVDSDLDYNEDKTIVEINGDVEPKGELVKENQIWIAAIAYHQGEPVGIRKWVSKTNLTEGESIPFQLYLYSLGPEIDKIALFSELH